MRWRFFSDSVREADLGLAMRSVRRLFALGLLSLALPAVSVCQGLQPAVGVFVGPESPTPYQLRLRRELLGADYYRKCQLLSVPSWEPERAVYMLRKDDGSFVVLSRVFRTSLWSEMQQQMQRTGGRQRGYAMGPREEAAALRKLRVQVNTRTAILDPDSADLISEACRQTLLRVAYPKEPGGGPDGTTYYAGHWNPGAFLSGTIWSPEDGSLAADFVAMAHSLGAFAESGPQQRETARLELLAKAKQLRDRLASDPSQLVGKTPG